MAIVQTDLLTVKEAAAFLRRSRASLDIWRCRRLGPAYLKTCGKILYRRTDLEAFLNGSLIEPSKLEACPVKVPQSTPVKKATVPAVKHTLVLDDDTDWSKIRRHPRVS